MRVPALKDLTQIKEKREIPEIRVWIHPEEGSDYYEVFSSFAAAENFITKTKGAERYPLVAFRGFELNLYRMEPEVYDDQKDGNVSAETWTWEPNQITLFEVRAWYSDLRGLLRSIYYVMALTLIAVVIGIILL